MTTLAGTVERVMEPYSFIRAEDQNSYFAFKKEYETPDLMKEGQRVTFFPAPTHKGLQAFRITAATDVQAA